MNLFKNMLNIRKIEANPLLFIWEALYGVKKWAFIGMALAFGLQLMKIYVPVFFSDMIDYFTKITPQEFAWHKMWWFLALILASYIGQSLFRMIRELIEELKVRNVMDAKIKLFAVDYLAKHSENYFSSQKTGQLAQKVTTCADKAVRVQGLISRLYSNFFLVIINFFFIGRISLWFLLLVFIFGSVSALTSYKSSFKLRDLNKKTDNMFDNFNGVLADSIGNTLNVKSGGNENFEISFVKNIFNKYKLARFAAMNKFQNNICLQQTMVCLFEICAMLLLIKQWYNGEISIGEITLVLVLMNSVLSVFSAVLNNLSELNTSLGALQAAMSPFIIEHEITDIPNAKPLKINGGEIEFKDVKFGYDNKKVFNKLSFKIKAGEKVGIVGASGSGKSTLINLLQRSYNLQGGKILIDGQNIADVQQISLHQAIALIPQDTSLFHRTVSQNIAYGKLNAKQTEIKKAAKQAYSNDFIKKLAKSYQTKVGEKGVKLSGGQRQRISIARAILKNSPILLLDEATSALDSKSEKHIQKAMNKLMENKTVIAIAHRLSTLKEMDRIIVLDKGKIIEQGKIEDLLNSDGQFRHLWEIQNKN